MDVVTLGSKPCTTTDVVIVVVVHMMKKKVHAYIMYATWRTAATGDADVGFFMMMLLGSSKQ